MGKIAKKIGKAVEKGIEASGRAARTAIGKPTREQIIGARRGPAQKRAAKIVRGRLKADVPIDLLENRALFERETPRVMDKLRTALRMNYGGYRLRQRMLHYEELWHSFGDYKFGRGVPVNNNVAFESLKKFIDKLEKDFKYGSLTVRWVKASTGKGPWRLALGVAAAPAVFALDVPKFIADKFVGLRTRKTITRAAKRIE